MSSENDYNDLFEFELCSPDDDLDFPTCRIVGVNAGPYPSPLVIPEDDGFAEVSEIGESLFEDSDDLVGVVLPETLEIIGERAFSNCCNLESVSILGCTYIAQNAFSDCCRLNDLYIANGVTIIGASAFAGCTSLKTLIIPESVTHIGPGAFAGCSQLRIVVIMNPEVVIEDEAFCNCPNVLEVYLPLSLANEMDRFFDDSGEIGRINWIEQEINPYAKRVLDVQLSQVVREDYMNGESGQTVYFDIKNNNWGSTKVFVNNVFFIIGDWMESGERWLDGYEISGDVLQPAETAEVAAVFLSDSIAGDFGGDGNLIGISVSLINSPSAGVNFDDRYLVYENDIGGDYSGILALGNESYAVVFRSLGGEWYPVATNIPKKADIPDVNEIEFANFVVRTNNFSCNLNHDVETIQAVVSVLTDDGSVIKTSTMAGYCKHCDCYFLLETDFRALQQKGRLLCQLLTWDEYREKGHAIFSGEDMKAESILKRCGYTVSANENLSSAQRQKILSLVLEHGLYTETGLCSFLDWLISYHGRSRTRNMSAAISKWSEDRRFVLAHKWESRRSVGIGSIGSPHTQGDGQHGVWKIKPPCGSGLVERNPFEDLDFEELPF